MYACMCGTRSLHNMRLFSGFGGIWPVDDICIISTAGQYASCCTIAQVAQPGRARPSLFQGVLHIGSDLAL